MKNLLFFVLIVASVNTYAQIPDSLNISLPWQSVFITDCDGDLTEKPSSPFDYVYISIPELTPVLNDNGECDKLLLNYYILNWLTGQEYNYIQLAKVLEDYPLVCEQNIVIEDADFPLEITAADLVQDYDENVDYSFDPYESVPSVTIEEGTDDFSLYLYNDADSTFCKSNVSIVLCEEELIIEALESIDVVFNGDHYIVITPDMLGISIEDPCDLGSAFIEDVYIEDPIIYYYEIGSNVTIKVNFILASGKKQTIKVIAKISGTPPPPIPIYIEDKDVEAGVETTFEVWSDELVDLISWQLRVNMIDATIVGLEADDQFESMNFNIFNNGYNLNTLWVEEDVQTVNVESESNWFTLRVLPEVNGTTLDLFSDINDGWSEISFETGGLGKSYEVQILFNVANKSGFNSSNDIDFDQMKLTSNVVSNEIMIQGLMSVEGNKNISMISNSGQLMNRILDVNNLDEMSVDVSDYVSGIYMVIIENENTQKSLRFFKK